MGEHGGRVPRIGVFFWDHFLDKADFKKNTQEVCGKNTDVFFRIDDDPFMIFVAGSLFSKTKGFHCQETHLVDQETQVLNVLIAMFLKYLSPVSYILTGTLAMLFIIWRCSDALGWDFWVYPS